MRLCMNAKGPRLEVESDGGRIAWPWLALASEAVGGTHSGNFGGGAENRGVEGESGGNASRGMPLGRVMMQGRMEQEHQNGIGAGVDETYVSSLRGLLSKSLGKRRQS
jgi:hypothetical protein